MHFNIIALFLALAFLTAKCENSDLYEKLCFAPKPAEFDLEWTFTKEPSEGWYSEISDTVAARHSSQVLMGERQSVAPKLYDDMCLRIKVTSLDGKLGEMNGYYSGYGDKRANWKCNPSKDVSGRVICSLKSESSDYGEPLHIYRTYSDGKNVLVTVLCLGNGEVGWHTASTTPKLTKEERKSVLAHIKSLGFSTDKKLRVKTYGKECSTARFDL